MCEKCRRGKRAGRRSFRYSRYCDDWWDDVPHGGNKGDRELKKKIKEEAESDGSQDTIGGGGKN